jgi:hypothetical protein
MRGVPLLFAALIALAAPASARQRWWNDDELGDHGQQLDRSMDPHWLRQHQAELAAEHSPYRLVGMALGAREPLERRDWDSSQGARFSLRLPRRCVEVLLSGYQVRVSLGRRKLTLTGSLQRITSCGGLTLRASALGPDATLAQLSLAVALPLPKKKTAGSR